MNSPHLMRPSWLGEISRFSAQLPEPPYLQKLRGGQSQGVEAEYEKAYSEEHLGRLAEAGVGLVWVHFFCGFGLEFEKRHIERARGVIEQARSRGLRAAARISLGALTPETLLLEESEAQNWFQVNQDGHATVFAAGGPFRVRPCYVSEGYLRYMERVVTQALEAKADLIHFDDLGFNPEPDTCRSPESLALFREMLRDKYGTGDEKTHAAGQARFGHNAFTHVRPPLFAARDQACALRTLEGAHLQEWSRFKVFSVSSCLERMIRCIERRGAACGVSAAVWRGREVNAEWLYGLDYEQLLPQLALATHPVPDGGLGDGQGGLEEGPACPGREASQAMPVEELPLGRARQHLLGRALGCGLAVGLEEARSEEQMEILAAESLALNPEGLWVDAGHGTPEAGLRPGGAEGFGLTRASRSRVLAPYLSFFREERTRLYAGCRVSGRLGVLLEHTSLAFNNLAPHQALAGVEIELLGRGIPYRLLRSATLQSADLAGLTAVILPGTECLDDGLAAELIRYVEGGGGLVLLGKAGSLDPWRRRRERPALAELFGPAYPHAARVQYGAGRAAYLPESASGIGAVLGPEGWRITAQTCASDLAGAPCCGGCGEGEAGEEHGESQEREEHGEGGEAPQEGCCGGSAAPSPLLEALAFCGLKPPLEIEAQGGWPVAYLMERDPGTRVLHLINYDPQEECGWVRIRWAVGARPGALLAWSPAGRRYAPDTAYDEERGELRFAVSACPRYLVLELQPSAAGSRPGE